MQLLTLPRGTRILLLVLVLPLLLLFRRRKTWLALRGGRLILIVARGFVGLLPISYELWQIW